MDQAIHANDDHALAFVVAMLFLYWNVMCWLRGAVSAFVCARSERMKETHSSFTMNTENPTFRNESVIKGNRVENIHESR